MTMLLEDGDELIFEGVPFSEPVHVVNGSILRYGEDQEDTGLTYLKDVGGVVKIDSNRNLISNSCALNGNTIHNNSVGPTFYIDEIGAGGSWRVTDDGIVPEDIDPREILRDYIGYKLSIPNWTTYVNPAWFETTGSRMKQRQIYLATDDREYISQTEYKQFYMDRTVSPISYSNTRHVYVSAPTKEQRAEMIKEMRDIFTGVSIKNPVDKNSVSYGINAFFIVREFQQDKDTKKDCPTWVTIFEIRMLW